MLNGDSSLTSSTISSSSSSNSERRVTRRPIKFFALTFTLSVCLLLTLYSSTSFVSCHSNDIASSLDDPNSIGTHDDEAATNEQSHHSSAASSDNDDFDELTATTVNKNDDDEDDSVAKAKPYTSPQINLENVYLFETFDNKQNFNSKWHMSTKENYKGKWEIESGPDRSAADSQLLLPLKARHYAISSKLNPPFKFTHDKPLVVQYEVEYRDGNDCGGSYLKMLRMSDSNDLTQVDDKTPYSIMFGPDKCGSEAQIHFIVQYKSPVTHKFEEKHWKGAKTIPDLLAIFNDRNSHLFRLVLNSNNDFQIFLDDKSVGKGNLLEDLVPAINPPKEIIDETDKKPLDWDDRTHIDDPADEKPADWDEEEPKKIPDPKAVKPADWLDDEKPLIQDPTATKPNDWEDMDGEWTAPLIDNPKCSKETSGCGKWEAPLIDNPKYKGKWIPKKIKNPAYKGKWEPRMIPNSDYFHDENPFKSLETIGAASFELWSMADNVAFDNLIIASNIDVANVLQFLTWQERKAQSDAASPSLITRAMHYLKVHPWLWAFILLSVALPLVLLIAYCCDYSGAKRRAAEAAQRKKTDKSRKDDDEEELLNEDDSNATSKSAGGANVNEDDDDDDNDDEEDVDEEDGENLADEDETEARQS